MLEAATISRPWASLDWDPKIAFVGWVARTAGVDLGEMSGQVHTGEDAVLSFVDEIVDATGGGEDQVKALVEWIVANPVLLRFVYNHHRESEMINRHSTEGGILDQKLEEAERLISAMWRYLP